MEVLRRLLRFYFIFLILLALDTFSQFFFRFHRAFTSWFAVVFTVFFTVAIHFYHPAALRRRILTNNEMQLGRNNDLPKNIREC
jgi:heme exporter protein D